MMGSAGLVLPHWFWLFMLLSRRLLEEECHMLQRQVSELQVSTALSLPPRFSALQDHTCVSVYLCAYLMFQRPWSAVLE